MPPHLAPSERSHLLSGKDSCQAGVGCNHYNDPSSASSSFDCHDDDNDDDESKFIINHHRHPFITSNTNHNPTTNKNYNHINTNHSENPINSNTTNPTTNANNNTISNSRNKEKQNKQRSISVLLFGQSIALALSLANAASSTLENDYQIQVPTFQMGIVYWILSFHLVFLFWRHNTTTNINDNDNGGDNIDNVNKRSTKIEQEYGNWNDNYEMIAENISIEHSDDTSSSSSDSNSTIKIMQQPSPSPPTTTATSTKLHKFPFTSLPLHTPIQTYLLLSILDVEANYLAMLSFQHTSLSSSMLLTSLSVVSTVLLRRCIFGRSVARYGRRKLIGVFLCLVGGCLWVREEFHRGGGGGGSSHPSSASASLQSTQPHVIKHLLQGDILALSAAFLYGLNDVLAEYFIKTNNNDRTEYLGMLGFCGAAFSFVVQVPLLEMDRVRDLCDDVLNADNNNISLDHGDGDGDYGDSIAVTSSSMMTTGTILFLLLCFIVMLCYFYMSVMSFLAVYDSTILNLSLQSCPLWAVVLTTLQKSLLGENNSGTRVVILPPTIFFVSLTLVMVGMFLYESNSGNESNSEKGVDSGSDCGSNANVEFDRDNDREDT